jgi:pimeloyl-ACP methyl ester carboxylesterase
MPYALSDGAKIYWRVDGHTASSDTPALVLVSSLGTDHTMWDPVIEPLSARYRVIRMDKRGHGQSDAPVGDYAMEQLARDVLAVADAAGAKQFHYAGVSIGGMIGMTLATITPQRILRLVLANTSAYVEPAVFETRIAHLKEVGLAGIIDMVMERFYPGLSRSKHGALSVGSGQDACHGYQRLSGLLRCHS